MSATIPVGVMSALVDDDDFDRLSRVTWMLNKGASKRTNYARYRCECKYGRLSISMARYIMRVFDDSLVVDHIDGNGLNNQKSNLRVCTQSENLYNQGRHSNNTSGFKGVYPKRGKWCAEIRHNRKKTHLGLYKTPELAAKAYKDGAARFHGTFARITNF